MNKMTTSRFEPNFLDAFCGAGGASLGITRAGCKVVVAINHDPRAIWAHSANHPEAIHLNDDIRKIDIKELSATLKRNGIQRINIWWSAECTHLSLAKGGASRDADSRMLSEDLVRYVRVLKQCGIEVDYIFVENVKEFLSWTSLVPKIVGKISRLMKSKVRRYVRIQIELMEAVVTLQDEAADLLRNEMDALVQEFTACPAFAQERGKLIMVPDPETKGSMYLKWIRHLEAFGYNHDYQFINAADLGAYQSRERYFAVFVSKELRLKINWPAQTHAKNPQSIGMFGQGLMPWKACRDILDLNDRGSSIFYGRTGKKPLVSATCDRIKTGMNKFGLKAMIDRYHSGSMPANADDPMPTVMASLDKALLQVQHMDNHSFGVPPVAVDSPLPTVMAKRDKYLMNAFVLPGHYGNPPYDLKGPVQTQVAARKHSYLCFPFIANQYSSSGKPNQCSPTDKPMWAVTTNNHQGLCLPYIVQQFGKSTCNLVDNQLGALTTNPKYWISTTFLTKHYSSGDNVSHVSSPMGTITTKDRFSLTDVRMLVRDSLEHWPITFMRIPDPREVKCRDSKVRVINPRIIPGWCRIEADAYIVDNRVIDIFYRMLKVEELKLAQGFPKEYRLDPTSETVAKKHIGNAVHVDVAHKIVEANCGPNSAYVKKIESYLAHSAMSA